MDIRVRSSLVFALSSAAVVVLIGGVLAAVLVHSPGPSDDQRVDATAFSQSGLADTRDSAVAIGASPTVTTAPPMALVPIVTSTTPVRARSSIPTTVPVTIGAVPTPAVTGTVVATTTTVPRAPPVSSWSEDGTNITAAMRVDQAAPLRGDPVRFTLDLSSSEPCCVITLSFGDGSADFFSDMTLCGVAPGTAHASITHTYATTGTYVPSLRVMAADWCHPIPGPPGSPPIPPIPRQVQLSACIAVGMGSAGKGCPTQPS